MPNGQSLAQLLLLAGISPEMVAAMNPDAQRASWTPAPAPSPDTSLARMLRGASSTPRVDFSEPPRTHVDQWGQLAYPEAQMGPTEEELFRFATPEQRESRRMDRYEQAKSDLDARTQIRELGRQVREGETGGVLQVPTVEQYMAGVRAPMGAHSPDEQAALDAGTLGFDLATLARKFPDLLKQVPATMRRHAVDLGEGFLNMAGSAEVPGQWSVSGSTYNPSRRNVIQSVGTAVTDPLLQKLGATPTLSEEEEAARVAKRDYDVKRHQNLFNLTDPDPTLQEGKVTGTPEFMAAYQSWKPDTVTEAQGELLANVIEFASAPWYGGAANLAIRGTLPQRLAKTLWNIGSTATIHGADAALRANIMGMSDEEIREISLYSAGLGSVIGTGKEFIGWAARHKGRVANNLWVSAVWWNKVQEANTLIANGDPKSIAKGRAILADLGGETAADAGIRMGIADPVLMTGVADIAVKSASRAKTPILQAMDDLFPNGLPVAGSDTAIFQLQKIVQKYRAQLAPGETTAMVSWLDDAEKFINRVLDPNSAADPTLVNAALLGPSGLRRTRTGFAGAPSPLDPVQGGVSKVNRPGMGATPVYDQVSITPAPPILVKGQPLSVQGNINRILPSEWDEIQTWIYKLRRDFVGQEVRAGQVGPQEGVLKDISKRIREAQDGITAPAVEGVTIETPIGRFNPETEAWWRNPVGRYRESRDPLRGPGRPLKPGQEILETSEGAPAWKAPMDLDVPVEGATLADQLRFTRSYQRSHLELMERIAEFSAADKAGKMQGWGNYVTAFFASLTGRTFLAGRALGSEAVGRVNPKLMGTIGNLIGEAAGPAPRVAATAFERVYKPYQLGTDRPLESMMPASPGLFSGRTQGVPADVASLLQAIAATAPSLEVAAQEVLGAERGTGPQRSAAETIQMLNRVSGQKE